MLYSCLERHIDGSYWYHGDTFETREQAEKFMEKFIWWDPKRDKRIIEHEKPINPNNGYCCTFDFHKFEFGGVTICTI